MSFLAVDFGGTRIRAAWFDDALTLLARTETPTGVRDGQDAVIARIISAAREVVPADARPRAIGIAAPGPLDAEHGVILHAETLPGWKDVPLASLVSAAFEGVPVFMQNDGNLGAIAEYAHGVRAGCDPLLYLTISTGIGGGAVINGRLFTGWCGLAFEPGHQLIPLEDGRVVKLEQAASGTAIGHLARERLQTTNAPSMLRQRDTIDGVSVGAAALAGDALALAIIAQAGARIGYGLVNLLHLFNPQAIILGGGVVSGDLAALILSHIEHSVRAHLLDEAFYPPDSGLISLATLGDDVCLIGAAQHALNGINLHKT